MIFIELINIGRGPILGEKIFILKELSLRYF